MTREEAIKRWSDIAETVFLAEERIANQWESLLRSAKSMTKEVQNELAREYCRAIATEILSRTSDEELAAME